MTIIETTVVILVILVLVSLLFVGARGWQNGTNRARCILNIRQMQMSVRAYASANSHDPGADLATALPPVSLLGELVGEGKYVPELPHCPGNGIYQFNGDKIPDVGNLYMECSLADEGHQPDSTAGW